MPAPSIDGPLKGVRILDLTHVWAGPLAVRFLADLGAEVVRVEAPDSRGPRDFPALPIGGWIGGEPGAEPWNANAIFVKLARNRRSLALDLKTDAGREAFLALVAVADVVMENFSARAMPSLGLDYDVLAKANPRIIYATMPGYGSSGPLHERVAFGPTVEAMSGLSMMMGYGPGEPRNTAIALMDPITATNAISGVVTALRRRARTRRGTRMEMSLHEGGVSYSGPWLIERQLGGAPTSLGNAHPNMAPHGIYRCAGEDEWVAVACRDDAEWRSLAEALALDESWRSLSLEQRLARREVLDEVISRWCADRDKDAVAEALQALGVSAGAVNTTPDMAADAQARARGFFVPYERFATPMPGNPIKMAELDSDQWTACPRLGEHNAEVLADWLGYEADQIAALADAGVIADKPPA